MTTQATCVQFSESTNDGLLMTASLDGHEDYQEVYFRSDDVALVANTETCLAAVLLPCMRTGSPLVARGKVSQRLLEAMDTIASLYSSWDPSLTKVDIRGVTPEPRSMSPGNRVAAFFSGGLDSFYTLLKHEDEITDLIFVHGFDIALKNKELRQAVSRMVRSVGSRLGKGVIEIETSLRPCVSRHVGWGMAHGAALAAVGHLLSPHFHRIYIASSYTYDNLFAWGSHPELDPLWSTESLEFVHDGCEARRVDKVALISKSDVALQSLRVCYKNPNNAYNCGQCEKCVRTMINLHAVGVLDRCTTFDLPLTPECISRLLAPDQGTRIFLQENLYALESREADQPLCNAIREVLDRPLWKTRALRFLRSPVNDTVSILRKGFPETYQRLRRTYHSLRRRRFV